MTVTLDRNAQAIASGVESLYSRSILGCVAIGNNEIIATDGFMTVRRPVDAENKPVLVPGKDIVAARDREVTVSQDGEKITIQGKKTIETKAIEGTFPNIDYPKKEVKAFVALSVPLLKKLLKTLGGEQVIMLMIRSSADAVEFVAGETRGLVMPLYISEKDNHWR